MRVGRFAEAIRYAPDDGALALMAWACGPQMVEAARREIEADPDEGIAADERAKVLGDLTNRLAGLETEEEQLIRLAERRGVPILRRVDAPPQVVLAPDARPAPANGLPSRMMG